MTDRFGGWSIDQVVFGWMMSNLRIGSRILELGSGWATGKMAEYYTMNSIEDADSFIGKHKSNYIYAKSDSGWYDRTVLEAELPKIKYDLILIDGPEHNKRWRIMENMDLFDWNKPVIIDDCQEGDVMMTAQKIASDYCKRPFIILNGLSYDNEAPKKAVVIP